MYVHIFIGTYILSEGSEYPSEIFWEIFWYKKFCGKINMQHNGEGVEGEEGQVEMLRNELGILGEWVAYWRHR